MLLTISSNGYMIVIISSNGHMVLTISSNDTHSNNDTSDADDERHEKQ